MSGTRPVTVMPALPSSLRMSRGGLLPTIMKRASGSAARTVRPDMRHEGKHRRVIGVVRHLARKDHLMRRARRGLRMEIGQIDAVGDNGDRGVRSPVEGPRAPQRPAPMSRRCARNAGATAPHTAGCARSQSPESPGYAPSGAHGPSPRAGARCSQPHPRQPGRRPSQMESPPREGARHGRHRNARRCARPARFKSDDVAYAA